LEEADKEEKKIFIISMSASGPERFALLVKASSREYFLLRKL
jgi:hypothetical protein